jgi:predicted Zn-dependent protease
VAAPPALPTPPATHPAVAALVSQSNQQLRAGDPDLAAASLERALRIEPENPWLWHHLAVVRLLQRQDEQAVQIAARSNALTSDRVLQARNWRAMAQAQERLGRPAAARSAAARAQALDAGG